MKELLKKLGVTQPGFFSEDDNYVIDLEDSNEYNTVFGKLDKSDLIEENEDESAVTTSVSNIMYTNDNFSLNLVADFDNDIYKLVVHES